MAPRNKISGFIKPMLAKETDLPFDDAAWLFEIKWDGYRAIAEKNKSKILLYSRNGNSFALSYPIITNELLKIEASVVIDGEIVVLDAKGNPSFQLLQHYGEDPHHPIQYQVFDLLKINNRDITDLPLVERKEMLKKIIPASKVIRYADHIIEKGKSFFALSKTKDLEGVMAKEMHSRYFPGQRTSNWLKIKHHKTIEAIIAGYTQPYGSRKYFGALILGVRNGKKLKYIGHTGGGFNQVSLKDIFAKLQPLRQPNSPFEHRIPTNAAVSWVQPKIICEVKYAEMTADGKLRQPIFLHLRVDKKANDVNMSTIKTALKATTPKSAAVRHDGPGQDSVITVGKSTITITHRDKIYFPGDGVTKSDVVNYYLSMSAILLPYLKGRPESLLRNPNGIHEQGFFQKDSKGTVPSYVKIEKLSSESARKNIDYIICDNPATLAYMNNLGCIEINPWHSTIKNLDHPDYLILDLDPSENNTFEQVTEAAQVIKQLLDKAGAVSYCKTSGASGLHIYVPTAKKYSYEQVKNFAHIICQMANSELTEVTTLERNLQKRGNKHIYLDYLQNSKGKTIASVYSLRPRDGATVSTPLRWSELKPGLSPQQFNIHNTLSRVKKEGDLFAEILGPGINLNKCLKNLGA